MPRCLLVFEPPDGGVAEHVRQLALELPAHGWEVEVAGPADAATYPALEHAGVPLTRLPIGRALRPSPYARALAQLTRILRDRGPDVVHLHSSKAGAVGRVAARVAGVPAVYTPHCFAFIGPHGPGRAAGVAAVERALARLTGAIVCVAEAERAEALRRRIGGGEKLRVVHNGCADCTPEPEPDPELEEFAAAGPLAACMTVLRPQKAVDTFLRAAPRVLREAPGARLAVIGDGPERKELERLAGELDVGERLRFFAFHPPAARQLASIDVFVLPSAWEAFPISVLEALACGVPQVATDVGGTSEAVADGVTGLLCPPADPAALAGALGALLRDPGRREQMARASVQRHRERFGIERMIAGTVEVYDEVVRAARAATVSP